MDPNPTTATIETATFADKVKIIATWVRPFDMAITQLAIVNVKDAPELASMLADGEFYKDDFGQASVVLGPPRIVRGDDFDGCCRAPEGYTAAQSYDTAKAIELTKLLRGRQRDKEEAAAKISEREKKKREIALEKLNLENRLANLR